MGRRQLGTRATSDTHLATLQDVRILLTNAAENGVGNPSFKTFADASQNNVNQQVPAGQFTKINLPTENADEGNLYDAANSEYRVPETGIYTCAAVVRIPDDVLLVQNIGLGIHASNFDGPWFVWNVTRSENTNPTRQAFAYARTARFIKDDLLRLYTWSGSGYTVQAAQMTIVRSAFSA